MDYIAGERGELKIIMGYIIIGGDIVPTKSNMAELESGDISKVVDSGLMDVLEKAAYRIFNLETPITDRKTPIEKEGPCFSTSVKSVRGLKKLNPDLFTLANNHILDQGGAGLRSTLEILRSYSIGYVGVGANLEDADKAYYFELDGNKIGVYGCVEHEYSTATRKTAGANPFDALITPDSIRSIRKQCDYLIVLYHGGKEYYQYPSPELQKRCRKLADCGADVILCQHSHCIGAYEEYRDSKILYGQGNFLLDRYVKAYEKYFQSGLIIKLEIGNGKLEWSFIPIQKSGGGVRLADMRESGIQLDGLETRSRQILGSDFVEAKYKEHISITASRYLVRISRFGYILSAADNRIFSGKLLNHNLKKCLGKHHRLALQNCLQCEVHNEALRTLLDNKTGLE